MLRCGTGARSVRNDAVSFHTRFPSSALKLQEWYEAIRLLKKQVPKLKVHALYTGKPDDKLLHYLLGEHRMVLDGLLIDWEFGPGACWSSVSFSLTCRQGLRRERCGGKRRADGWKA